MFAATQDAHGFSADAGLWALVKIACVFIVVVFLIRRGMAIGYVLLLAAVLLGLVLEVGFVGTEGGGFRGIASGVGNMLGVIVDAATSGATLRLLALVLTITVFGGVLKRVEKLRELADSLLALLRDRRWAMAWLASLIGLLPMPGGAMISAPMVGEVAKELDLSREDKTAINYWMRHIWEYVDPLFPALLMASSVFAVPVPNLMLAHAPLSLAAMVGGVVFLLRLVPHHQRRVGDEAGERSIGPVVKAISPVLIVVAAAILPQALSVVIKNWPGAAACVPGGSRWLNRDFLRVSSELSMLVALLVVITLLLASACVSRAESWRLIRGGVTLKMMALVLGVCVMKGIMDASGTIRPIAAFFQSTGLPAPVVIGSVVFVVGLLLGYTFGFVAICYPILQPMMRLADGGLNYPLVAFAFGIGFLGVLLSPVHLCLVLSREYFDANWGGVYRRLAAPALVVFATACLLLLGA